MQKNPKWLKISPLVKNPQFLSNQVNIKALFALLPTQELVIYTKFL